MNQLVLKKKEELNKKKKKGFTLVELIIVIAIIAILAAIAIPKFGSIKSDANEKTDIATAKTIATLVSKELADDKVSDTIATSVPIDAITAKKAGDAAINITSDLDGKTTTTSGNKFYVKITSGNVEVFDGNTGTPKKLFPQS